jgi:hypothetical protein
MWRVRTAVVTALIAGGSMAAEVAYLGIADGAAPAFEEEFGGLLRKAILSESGLALVDEQTVRHIRRRIGVEDQPAVPRTLLERMLGFVSDTTLVVWGRISDYSIRARRRKLIRTYVEGSVTVSLNVYSVHYKEYAFGGEVVARTEIPKGWIFFDRVDKAVHVSARDKAAVMERLQRVAASRTAALIAAVVGSQAGRIEDVEGVQAHREEEPSVSDLFGLPSVEGEPVDDVEPELQEDEETTEESADETEQSPEKQTPTTDDREAPEPEQGESAKEEQTPGTENP